MTTLVLKTPLFKVYKKGRYGQLQRQGDHRHVAVHFKRNRVNLTSYIQHPFNCFGEETGWIVKLCCSFVNIMEWGHEICLKPLAVYFANQQICIQQKKVTDPWREVKEFSVSVSLCQAPRKVSVCLRPYVTASEEQIYILGCFSVFRKLSRLMRLRCWLSVCPYQFTNCWTDFHETWFERYVCLVIPPDIRNVQFYVRNNSHVEDAQICEVGSVFNINSNYIYM